jgi:hypothetical protein
VPTESCLSNTADPTIDFCASQFRLYSVDQLHYLDKQMLHELLSSELLSLESEDALLQLLIDLGQNYLEFWGYIEVVFLTTKGISLFVGSL